MDGLEVTKEVRALFAQHERKFGVKPDCRILLHSATTIVKDKNSSIMQHFDGVAEKPLNIEDLKLYLVKTKYSDFFKD